MAEDQALTWYGHFINGQSAPPSSGQYLPTEDPFSGKPWAFIARGNDKDVAAAVSAAKQALAGGRWPSLSPSERGRLLWSVADRISANAQRLGEIASLLAQNGGKKSVTVNLTAPQGRSVPCYSDMTVRDCSRRNCVR